MTHLRDQICSLLKRSRTLFFPLSLGRGGQGVRPSPPLPRRERGSGGEVLRRLQRRLQVPKVLRAKTSAARCLQDVLGAFTRDEQPITRVNRERLPEP
jgi:hypothetical protein